MEVYKENICGICGIEFLYEKQNMFVCGEILKVYAVIEHEECKKKNDDKICVIREKIKN